MIKASGLGFIVHGMSEIQQQNVQLQNTWFIPKLYKSDYKWCYNIVDRLGRVNTTV